VPIKPLKVPRTGLRDKGGLGLGRHVRDGKAEPYATQRSEDDRLGIQNLAKMVGPGRYLANAVAAGTVTNQQERSQSQTG